MRYLVKSMDTRTMTAGSLQTTLNHQYRQGYELKSLLQFPTNATVMLGVFERRDEVPEEDKYHAVDRFLA